MNRKSERTRLYSYLLLATSIMFFLVSSQPLFVGLQVANHEYWQIWYNASDGSSFKILGFVVSGKFVIRYSIIIWGVASIIAIFCFTASRYLRTLYLSSESNDSHTAATADGTQMGTTND